MELTTNIRLILDKVLRHPLMQELTFETAVDYTVDFLRIVGAPAMFLDKLGVIEIKEHRGLLPCDFHLMILVRNTKDKIAFRYATDSFHESKCSECADYTYTIQGNVIITSIKEGKIEIAYKAIAVDDEGYPLLPDNSSFTRALELYIKKLYFTILFDLGKINANSLLNVQQEYAWAVGDCESEFKRLSIDKAESFTNAWNTLVQRADEHRNSFNYNGTKERIKLQ